MLIYLASFNSKCSKIHWKVLTICALGHVGNSDRVSSCQFRDIPCPVFLIASLKIYQAQFLKSLISVLWHKTKHTEKSGKWDQVLDRRAARAKQILFGEFGFVGCFLLAWGFLTAEKSIIQICIKRLRKMQNVMRANMKESEGMRHCLRQRKVREKNWVHFLSLLFYA